MNADIKNSVRYQIVTAVLWSDTVCFGRYMYHS